MHRICIVSGYRLHELDAITFEDISYAVPIPHIWSVLEPTIAICTSCLPVTRPVFLRLYSSYSASQPPPGHTFKPRSAESNGTGEEAAAGPFRRLNEQEIPLKSMTRGHVTICKEGGGEMETSRSREAVEREVDGIRVTREWGIRY